MAGDRLFPLLFRASAKEREVGIPRGLRLKGARSANAPKFILFSDTRDRRLLDRTLTRLAQPISALMTVQLGVQLFGK